MLLVPEGEEEMSFVESIIECRVVFFTFLAHIYGPLHYSMELLLVPF